MDLCKMQEQLTIEFERYRQLHPSMSLEAIARKIGKTEGTLRNLLKSNSVPRPDTLLNLMGLLTGKSIFKDVIEFCPSEISQYLRDSFPMYATSDSKVKISEKIEGNISDHESYLILMLCSDYTGSKREDLKTMINDRIDDKIDDLIEKNILEQSEDGFIRTVESNLYIPSHISKNFIGEFLRYWEPKKMDKKNLLYAFLSGVSDEFREYAAKKLTTTINDLYEEANKKENRGPFKFFSMVFGQTINNIKVILLAGVISTFLMNPTFAAGGEDRGNGGVTGGGGSNKRFSIERIR